MSIVIEACCASLEDAVEAASAGVQRVELNSAIELGGLTPSSGMVQAAKNSVKIPVMSMLRPRTGGFCYTQLEFEQMCEDCKSLIAAGSDGIVFGILHEDGTIDSERCEIIARLIAKESMKKPKRVQMVFHRAFDVVPDWQTSLEELIALGFDRVLTSGQKPRAIDATNTLRQLNSQAKGRIEILACGGIRLDNAEEVILKTGINQIHLRAKKSKIDNSINGKLSFNSMKPASENSFDIVDKDHLSQINKKLNAK